MAYDYDILVIGPGPAGQNAAVQATKLGRRAALVECGRELGGVCVNTGTIPSKTIREAVVYLTGLYQRAIYGQSYRLKDDITIKDLRERTRVVVERERDVVRDLLLRNHVTIVPGLARFLDSHTLAIAARDGKERRLSGEKIVIATGSRPAHPPGIDFADPMIFDSDEILRMTRIPSSLVVVGAGVIGVEYASIAAALGASVTVVDARDEMLEFCDGEIVESLRYHLRD
ncbi:MAG TPA: FAD-dependent oxidoreductase, partial [Gaiellaceae bacterium]|nr:FAD-dependent oxidoreductase [Gaiellaceae bacterium]